MKKYIFVSYSTREPMANLLLSLLWIVFSDVFDLKLTPSALESGSSQLDQICRLTKECAFAVVILDGLRPNVVFEYGLLRGFGRPIILLKGDDSVVDIRGFADPADLTVKNPQLVLDSHFSDVKDQNFATWYPADAAKTVKLLWEEYRKKKGEIEDYAEIKEPRIW